MATEKKLIYADDARRAILKADPKLAYCIERIKAVDAVEVVHGRWIDQSFVMNGGVVRFCICSECRHEMTFETSYCPNCGAKMDGGADNG